MIIAREVLDLDDNLQFRNRLKVARAENNMSQEVLARKAGVTRQTISSIETGQYCPSARLGLIICNILGKKFENIFYLEEGNENE